MNRKCRPKSWTSSGFTLVELLVVVSIIALLIAILMPSLKKARESAKRVACNSTIRGIATAGLTYAADDPHENGIPVNPVVDEESQPYQVYFAYGGKGGRGGGTLGARSESAWGGKFGMGAANRPLNSVIYKTSFQQVSEWDLELIEADQELDLAAYHCSGDRSFPGMHYTGWKKEINAKTGYDYFGTSYACNPMWVHDPNDPDDRAFSNSMYYRPMSRVPNPGNTIMFWEAAARFAIYIDNTEEFGPPGSGQSGTDCRQYWKESDGFVAKGFHGEPWHFNIAFGDGHAGWSKVKSFPVATGNKLPASCGTNGRLCQCVVVRGRGWQMDTFPAPMIKTNHATTGGSMIEVASGAGSDNVVAP